MYNFFNDIESEIDYLGYNPYIEAFNYLLINNSELITPPVVFGIHGKWGTGKSTFMKLIKNKLDKDFYTIAINPWEYGENQNFITIFLAKLYNNKEVKKNIFSKENDSAINFLKCIFKPLKLSVDVKPLKLEYDFNKFSLDEQKNVIDSFISENFALKESISYILNHNFFSKKKIVVFIDDLDRCSVKKIMEVIESIKLIFNSPNCIFFLGCDTNYIESALSIEYEKFIENNEKLNFDFKSFSREYLEKIIQIPFYIPSISEKAVIGYIDSILYSKKDQYKPIKVKENLFNSFRLNLKGDFISDLIVKSNLNPRRIKRILNLTFLNYIFMKFKNNEQKNFNIDTKLLSLLCVTREVYPGYYKAKLSNEQACKNTFKKMFNRYYHENIVTDLDEIHDYTNDNNNFENKNNDLELDILEENIYDLFKLYFSFEKIKDIKSINNRLKNILLYISITSMNIVENDNELEWGELVKIKSEITGKSINPFLSQANNNSAAKNIIYWFFYDIYLKNKENYVLGIVKNVNIYRACEKGVFNPNENLIFRFQFNKENGTFYIVFEWRNTFKTIVKNLDKYITSKKYNFLEHRIEITNETTEEELQEIKNNLLNILSSIDKNREDDVDKAKEQIAIAKIDDN